MGVPLKKMSTSFPAVSNHKQQKQKHSGHQLFNHLWIVWPGLLVKTWFCQQLITDSYLFWQWTCTVIMYSWKGFTIGNIHIRVSGIFNIFSQFLFFLCCSIGTSFRKSRRFEQCPSWPNCIGCKLYVSGNYKDLVFLLIALNLKLLVLNHFSHGGI